MIRGLYTAATGMNVQSKKLDIISNDLANVSTTGYKKDTTIISSFGEELLSRLNDREGGVSNNAEIGPITWGAKVADIHTDYTQGSIINTNEDLDVAIQGDGFFVVQTPNGTAYTRDGNFTVNQNGSLVTRDGYAVMGENGPIEFGEDYLNTGGNIKIKADGEVILDDISIDYLDMASFADNQELTKMNDNLYITTSARQEFNGSLIQGYLEASNVNSVEAMVDMITVSRTYEANQKVLQTQDSLLGKAVNDIGRA